MKTIGFAQQKPVFVATAKIFADNMVFQQGIPVKIWGTATPGEIVSVKLGTKTAAIRTAPSGKWLLSLPAFNYGGPYVLRVSTLREVINYQNVMIGEVWLASGQSNMNFAIGRPVDDMEKVLAGAAYPMIREFNVPAQVSKMPLDDLKGGQWLVCNSHNVPEFSAVAYFFARKLYLKKKVAIGIIHASYGGTPIEAWTSKEALLANPDFKSKIPELFNDTTNWAQMQAKADSVNLEKDNIISTAANGQGLGAHQLNDMDSSWKGHDYPVRVADIQAPPYSLIWLRKTVVVPAGEVNKDYELDLGKVLESDITYINGIEVGRSKQLNHTFYTIPHGVIRSGENVIAIRLVSQWGNGQLGSPVDKPVLKSLDRKVMISLGGTWLYNYLLEPELPLGKGYQGKPSALFNAMIHPLIPYGIKGILWYQGEANAGDYEQYKNLQVLMFTDWRTRWAEGDIPFVFVQLPGLQGAKSWPLMREAQAFSLTYPGTGMAVSIDVGDPYDVHPHNKKPVGERLALLAGHIAYGYNEVYEGPVFNQSAIEGNAIRIGFKNTENGIVLKNTAAGSGFFIAGDDHVFHLAKVQLQGTSLLISSPLVAKPLAFRYAWDPDPNVTLFNKIGLPAAPFRTDNWKP
ncbi:sialate O-acetylesterase [Mucilaginibacter sp. SP1R1]|uniref:sialate O-acetylesterase n=1 Tax=Mucilaginibacter sp. SP1R1 TaxID=2723091 RepID=UPI00161BA7D6|nr:sialate O-acetylesterase [Mucilaginibacter sp. SP1R1]